MVREYTTRFTPKLTLITAYFQATNGTNLGLLDGQYAYLGLSGHLVAHIK